MPEYSRSRLRVRIRWRSYTRGHHQYNSTHLWTKSLTAYAASATSPWTATGFRHHWEALRTMKLPRKKQGLGTVHLRYQKRKTYSSLMVYGFPI